jgi:N-sulfoglucosamine sulfohydrolase
MIKQMWKGSETPPGTDTPQIIKAKAGVIISCKTKGASIGYRVIKAGAPEKPEIHTVQTWDFGFVFNTVKNGTKRLAGPIWQIYNGTIIPLQKGDTLKVNALRIGYKPALINYVEITK